MSCSENSSQRIAVAVVYVAAMFMSVLDTTIVIVALPAISRDFNVTATAAGSVTIAYLVALTVFIPVSGWLGDRIGGKRALLGAIGLFTLGSALCGVAGNLPMLVVCSAIQGIGGAVMLPVGLAMLFRTYPPSERIRLSSTLALVTAIGPALGPILGGLFTTEATWRLVFFVNVPIGVVAIAWGALRLDSHAQPHPGRLDVTGLLLSALGFGALMAGISEGPTAGWTDPLVIGGIIIGAILLVVLVVVELRTTVPLIRFRLFRNRLFAIATGLYGVGSVVYIGALYLISLFLQSVLSLSAIATGLTSVGSAVGVVLGGQLVTRVLYPRLGPRRLTAAGLVVIAAALAMLALVTAHTNLWLVRVDLLALGLGVSAVFIPAQAFSMATIESGDVGRASPIFNAGKQLGSAVGVAALSTVVAVSAPGSAGASSAGVDAYHLTFLVAAGIALASIVVALAVDDREAAVTMHRRTRMPRPSTSPRTPA